LVVPRIFRSWLGQLASSFGDTLHYIALVILVYQLTGQGIAVAGLVAAEVVPVLVLGPIAGVVIDRFSRKSVLIGADLFRSALALSLLWPQGAWHAYLVAAGMAAGNTFFNPTVQGSSRGQPPRLGRRFSNVPRRSSPTVGRWLPMRRLSHENTASQRWSAQATQPVA
jgi:MFS family permease